MFRLKLFGAPSLEGPGGPVTGRPVQRRRLALLALLALARDRGLTREKLVGYLWPQSDPERARHALSDSLYRINQAVGGEAVMSTGDDLRLNRRLLPTDVWDFEEAIERGDWSRAVTLHVAPFLDGFYLTDALELERWVDTERERLGREQARALETLAEGAEQKGDTGRAVELWRALSAHSPYSSRVALRLVRALEGHGERAAALKHAHRHVTLLKEDLGVEPGAELQAFLEQPSSPGPPDREPPTVAVLPFVPRDSATAQLAHLAEGLTEDLIADLAKIGALRVISRASVMRLKDSSAAPKEIAESLGAGWVVTGSVRRQGDRVRVTVELVDARRETCLWAESYERELVDVFAIQSEVALSVAAELRAKLSADEKSRIAQHPTRSIDAYGRYLEGRHWFVRFTADGLRRGIRYFERAIEIDPDYALAHANLAMAYAEMGETGVTSPTEAYSRARRAAEAALSLNNESAEAHCVRGQLRALVDFDWAGAERDFRRALELSPSSADTWDLYGRLCSALGRYDESVSMHRRALELDPLAHRADYATALIRAGRPEEALSAAESAVEFDPDYPRGCATLGWALIGMGRWEDGLAQLERASSLAPDSTAWLGQLGQAYALRGRREDALAVLDRLEHWSDGYVSPYHKAYVLTGLGEAERAIDQLEIAQERREGAVYGIKGSFLFAPLRSHPRFASLLRRMKLS